MQGKYSYSPNLSTQDHIIIIIILLHIWRLARDIWELKEQKIYHHQSVIFYNYPLILFVSDGYSHKESTVYCFKRVNSVMQ
jgi:hypothetical protein